MDMSIWSAYFITAVWDHCVLLGLNLHGAAEQHIIFCTGVCFPHCPCRNCHLWRLPKFYIFGQLLLKNEKNKANKQNKYLYYKQNKPSPVPLVCLRAEHKYSEQLLTLDKKNPKTPKTIWGLHCCNTVGTLSSFSPQGDWSEEFTTLFLILDDRVLDNVANFWKFTMSFETLYHFFKSVF